MGVAQLALSQADFVFLPGLKLTGGKPPCERLVSPDTVTASWRRPVLEFEPTMSDEAMESRLRHLAQAPMGCVHGNCRA